MRSEILNTPIVTNDEGAGGARLQVVLPFGIAALHEELVEQRGEAFGSDLRWAREGEADRLLFGMKSCPINKCAQGDGEHGQTNSHSGIAFLTTGKKCISVWTLA